jgi:hypothetical protein
MRLLEIAVGLPIRLARATSKPELDRAAQGLAGCPGHLRKCSSDPVGFRFSAE